MHKTLALSALLLTIFTAGFLAGAYWSGEAVRGAAVKSGYLAHNGHTYEVTGIRPRGE